MEKIEVYVNISLEEFSFICRICLSKGELKPFEDELSSLFFALTDIQVKPDDILPNNICRNCICKLQDISQFIDSSKLNNAGLQRIVEEQFFPEEGAENCEESTNNVFDESVTISNADIKVDPSTDSEENEEENDFFDNCEMEFIFDTEVTENEESVTSDAKPFKCFHCNKIFSSENELEEHLVSHSDEQLFECELCGKKFKFSHNLVRHTNVEHKDLKSFICEICNQDIDTDVAEHMKIHFKEDPEDVETKLNDSQLQEFIYEKNINFDNIEIHSIESEQTENQYYCEICNKNFSQSFKYKVHMERHSGGKIYNCSKCRRKYLTEKALKEHQSDHDGEEYTCDICGKIYKLKERLAVHLKTHSDVRPYNCEECGKSFKMLSYYNHHMKNHKAVKDFLCSVCGKSFTTSKFLNIHMRIHNGEKPYACKLCGKRFTQTSSLNLHVRNHSGIRKFRCTVCDQRFLQHHHLQDHMKLKHTKEKEYRCFYCDKEFGLRSSLKRHHLIHTGVTPHNCACGAGFRETRQLRNHAKRCPQSSSS